MQNSPIEDIVSRIYPGALVRAVVPLAGGVSADVSRLDIILADGGTTSLVLRSHGASHSGHPAELEHALLDHLYRSGVPVPRPLIYDATAHNERGAPFLVMEFMDGGSAFPLGEEDHCIDAMADALAEIHCVPLDDFPALPLRCDPLPEVFDFLPDDAEWQSLRERLSELREPTAYRGRSTLLHGDFWPSNLLWRDGVISAILDWEDAAIGDPLSDVACSRLELRYLYGSEGMTRFTQAYAKHRPVDPWRLALWQVYVAAAAHQFMGNWGLEEDREAHMRACALASIREAGEVL